METTNNFLKRSTNIISQCFYVTKYFPFIYSQPVAVPDNMHMANGMTRLENYDTDYCTECSTDYIAVRWGKR